MLNELLVNALITILVSALSGFVFYRTVLTRLFSIEDQILVLQERHLSTVRRAAINKRWEAQDELDANIEQIAAKAVTPTKKGWNKWPSKSGDSSGESAAG